MASVGESYFFRNREFFNTLGFLIRNKKVESILSVGCARGEEPYSVAIAAHMAGVLNDISIYAFDKNPDYISQAKKGVYTRWSLRGVPEDLLTRYFSREGEERFKLVDFIRRAVYFFPGDITDLSTLPPVVKRKFSLVICRNLIMYYEPEEREVIARNLKTFLHENSLLFVAPQEIFLLLGHGFSLVSTGSLVALGLPRGKEEEPLSASYRLPPESTEVLGLMDQGRYGEAEREVERILSSNPLDPTAYFLGGLLSLLKDDLDRAEEFFRKSLFLNPKGKEAARFLSLIHERRGENGLAGDF